MEADITQQAEQAAQAVAEQAKEVIQPLAATVRLTQAQAVAVQETHQEMSIPLQVVTAVPVVTADRASILDLQVTVVTVVRFPVMVVPAVSAVLARQVVTVATALMAVIR